MRLGERLGAYAYIAPATLFMLVFLVYPMVSNLILSLNDVGLTFFSHKEYNWVGLDNYVKLFTAADGQLVNAIKNTACPSPTIIIPTAPPRPISCC